MTVEAPRCNATPAVNGQPDRALPAWLRELGLGAWHRVDDVWVCKATWTPDAADKVLKERNNRNRKPVRPQIAVLAASMKQDQFYFTGETVIINSDDDVADGQNRLYAGVASGKPFTALTVYGVDPDVFRVIDQGSRRSLQQTLELLGELNTRILATLLYGVPRFFATGRVQASGGMAASRMTMDDLEAGLGAFPGIRESAAFAAKFVGRKDGVQKAARFRGVGGMAVLHWVFSRVDRETAEKMLSDVASGSVPGDKPSWQPAKKLQDVLQVNFSATRTLAPGLTEAYAILAWNAIWQGRPSKLLYRSATMDYPRVEGWDYVAGLPYGVDGVRLLPVRDEVADDSGS